MYRTSAANVFVACCVFLAALPAYGADRQITVGGIFEKEAFFPSAFGSTLDSQNLIVEIVVDDTDPAIVYVPVGPVGPSGQPLISDVTVVPKSAITSLTAAIGNGSWTDEDIDELGLLNTGYTYGVLISGQLNDQTNTQPAIRFNLTDSNVGTVRTGFFDCNSGPCLFTSNGSAEDYIEGAFGLITAITASLTPVDVEPTIPEQIAALQEEVEILGISDALLDSVAAKLEAKSGDHPAAVKKLGAFINAINAQRGKRLTDAQADNLINRAQALIEVLTG